MPFTEKQREDIRVLASEITGLCETKGRAEIQLIIKRTIVLTKKNEDKDIEFWAHILQSGIVGVQNEKVEEISGFPGDWAKALQHNQKSKRLSGRILAYEQAVGLETEIKEYISEVIARLPISGMENGLENYRKGFSGEGDQELKTADKARARIFVLYIESVFDAVINKIHDYAASVLKRVEEVPRNEPDEKSDSPSTEIKFFVYTNLLYWPWSVVKFLYRLLWSFLETRKGKVITTGLGILGALFSIFAGIILIIKLLS